MKKMNKHFSALAIAALLLAGSISVGAASAYKEVTARQNTGMQVKSGDIELTLKDDNGNTLYPLTYNNVVYLPAEQLADLLGYDTTGPVNVDDMIHHPAGTEILLFDRRHRRRKSQIDCFKPCGHLCFSGCIC